MNRTGAFTVVHQCRKLQAVTHHPGKALPFVDAAETFMKKDKERLFFPFQMMIDDLIEKLVASGYQ
jgi:hypothetical protein